MKTMMLAVLFFSAGCCSTSNRTAILPPPAGSTPCHSDYDCDASLGYVCGFAGVDQTASCVHNPWARSDSF